MIWKADLWGLLKSMTSLNDSCQLPQALARKPIFLKSPSRQLSHRCTIRLYVISYSVYLVVMLKIINFIQVQACDGLGLTLEFVNTSAYSDSGCVLSGVGLKPDVCVYAEKSGRQRHTDFSRMEISIEFKRETVQDAFVDPPSASNRTRHNFERDSDQGKDARPAHRIR